MFTIKSNEIAISHLHTPFCASEADGFLKFIFKKQLSNNDHLYQIALMRRNIQFNTKCAIQYKWKKMMGNRYISDGYVLCFAQYL